MKTRNFTLIAAILMMGAVITATGQPGRGDRNGNHEKNDRRELKSASGTESLKSGKRRSDIARNDREMTGNRIHTVKNPVLQKESVMSRKEVMENRSYKVNKSGVDRYKRENNREYTSNREVRRNPAPLARENSRNFWGERNYSRNEWEHRNYNWSEHNRKFNFYYKKGFIPYYFRDNRHYWYYPEYGHILRGFLHEPVIFYSGNIPYYFEDGFFYRYYPGIGYTWVEEPYNIWFNGLPDHTVRVRIGGKVYFRFGNAYFRPGTFGFHLVVLPDRYYDRRYDKGVSFEISARF